MERARAFGWAGVLVAAVAETLSWLGEWQRRRQMRESFGMTSETLLRDIGLTPDDLQDALCAPLEDNSSEVLLRAALSRAGDW